MVTVVHAVIVSHDDCDKALYYGTAIDSSVNMKFPKDQGKKLIEKIEYTEEGIWMRS